MTKIRIKILLSIILVIAIVAGVFLNLVSQEKTFGWIMGVSERDNSYYLTVALGTFRFLTKEEARRDPDKHPNGYVIENLHKTVEYQIASDATITVESDALSYLVMAGLAVRPEVEGVEAHIQTKPLIELIQKAKTVHFDLATDLYEGFYFYSKNGVVKKVVQQYVP